MNNNVYWSKIIVFCILTYFFIWIEISVYQLLCIAYPIIYIWGFIAFEIFVAFGLCFIMYIILKSGRLLFFFSFLVCFICGFCFFFLFVIQRSPLIELVPKIILLILFLAGIILTRLKILPKIYNTYFRLITIGSSMALIALTYQRPFLLMKIQLFLLYVFSSQSVKFSFGNLTYRKPHAQFLPFNYIVAWILISIIGISSIILFALPTNVTIEAYNSPELIFWSSAVETPTDEATLDLCYKYDIGFVVVLREHYIDDGGASEKRHIEYLLNHSIITYICLGGGKDEFFLTTDNGDDFYNIFRTIKSWLVANNLYNYKNLRGFVVDAEIPKSYYDDLTDKDIYQKGEYFVNQMPTENKLEKIEDNLDKMIDEINDDNKKCGIIKLPTTFDNLDGDDDYNQLSNTIYSLDLDWDFSISMNYRTMHIPTWSDYLIRDMDRYDYTSDYEPAYLQEDQLERNIVPISQFYQEVSYEVYSSDVGVKQNRRYIFIGTFTKKFKDTSYMQNDEWKKDLDICRHFEVSKVFLYEWSGFNRYHSLTKLIKYNENRQKWTLEIPYNYMITRELFVAISVIFADKLLYI